MKNFKFLTVPAPKIDNLSRGIWAIIWRVRGGMRGTRCGEYGEYFVVMVGYLGYWVGIAVETRSS